MKKFVALVLMACMMLTFTAVAEEILAPKMIAAKIYDAQNVVVENVADDSVAVKDEAIAALDLNALGMTTMSIAETFVVEVADGKLAEGNYIELTVEIDAKLPLPTTIMAAGADGVWAKIDEYTADANKITFKLTEGGSVALLVAAGDKTTTQTTTSTSTTTQTSSNTTTTFTFSEDEFASFTPSVSGKPAPVTVPSVSTTDTTVVTVATITTSTSETVEVPAGNNLGVVPVSERNYVQDGAKLEKAYQSILNNELKDLLGDMVVRDLFEVSLNGKYAEYLNEEGATIEMTFDADIDTTKAFKVLCSCSDDTWHEIPAENITINADGSVTLKLEEVGVIAFVVEADAAPAADVTSPV